MTAADYAALTPIDPGYRYEFAATELEAIKRCHDVHGFAVVKQVLTAPLVSELKAEILAELDPNHDLGPGETRVRHAFVEFSAALLKLFDVRPWLAIQEHLLGTTELTVHRSAAILKNVGAGPVYWHTDHRGAAGVKLRSNDYLNNHEYPNGKWFYLNGTHPSRAGLAVIADSHPADWQPPAGFQFTDDARSSFCRVATPVASYEDFDVPGMVPLFTDPGDLILFASRTYHAAFPHHGAEPRLSCALGLRPGREPWPVPWPLPPSATQLLTRLPERLKPYFAGYPSIDTAWRAAQ